MSTDQSDLDRVIAQLAEAKIAPPLALMQLIMAARSPHDIDAALAHSNKGIAADWTQPISTLWTSRRGAWELVKSVMAQADHTGQADASDPVRHWQGVFDRLASISPEAAVALYSLGDTELLEAATDDIIDWLLRSDYLRTGMRIADIGCGIGRLTSRLAAHADFAVGLDISDALLAHARERCRSAGNAALVRHSGRDLACLRSSSVDLVLASDVMPYLVASGDALAQAHMSEFSRILKPDGTLAVLNWSYQGSADYDCRQARAFAESADLIALQLGSRVFSSWDAKVYVFRRSGCGTIGAPCAQAR